MNNLYETIRKETERNHVVLVTTSMSHKREGNTNTLKRRLIGEEELQGEDNQELKKVLMSGKPDCIPDSRDSNGKDVLFVEPYFPRERLIVLGGGHIALPLVEIAARVGFQVTVVDDRPSFANSYRFPTAEKVLCESFTTCFKQLKITRNDYIVIITRGHRHDAECLRQILKEPESIYLGMIGSKRRVAVVKQDLAGEGYEEERLNRICTPIGLDIGAATPEEISISIIAELIKRKRKDAIESCYVNRSDLDYHMIPLLETFVDTRCSMVTILAVKGSVPRGVGAKMIVKETGQIQGSIGGGCSEAAIMRTAIEMIGTHTWKIIDIDMTAEAAEEEGMVCGGIMTVLIEDMSQ